MHRTPTCDYCGEAAELVMGDVIHPNDPKKLGKYFWQCKPCDAWISTHENSPSHKPVGRLANAELRAAKRAALDVFTPLWMVGFERHQRSRGSFASKSDCISIAYVWLAEQMGIPDKRCHIGTFDVEQCNHAREVCMQNGNDLLLRFSQ